MTEEEELQARIASLSGRINLHKQQEQASRSTPPFSSNGTGPGSRAGRLPLGTTDEFEGYGRGSQGWAPQRGTPYGYPRSRGSRGAAPVHRNRTLVLNTANNNSTPDVSNASTDPVPRSSTSSPGNFDPSGNFVVKRDRHMQLINASVYDKISQQRAKEMEESSMRKRQERNYGEKATLNSHFNRPPAQGYRPGVPTGVSPGQQPHQITVGSTVFNVVDGGSKLLRVSRELDENRGSLGIRISHSTDDPKSAQSTPKQAVIAGVTFYRSKNGNLYRAGLVKAKKGKSLKKIPEPCPRFTTTGTCPKGPHCRYQHDASKTTICKDFLQGKCAVGDACDLSHDPTPNRVPACVHFLKGNCTNSNCRYAHVRVNPGAPVCRAFGKLGYCEKGANCTERHVFECPDYANTGVCRNKKCRLPHVDRAGNLRRLAATQNATSDNESPDLSSDEEDYEEIDGDDVDEDEIMIGSDEYEHDLTQQRDYIPF